MVLRDSAPADRAVIATSKKDKGEIEKEKKKSAREEEKNPDIVTSCCHWALAYQS